MANPESINPNVIFRADGNQNIGLGHVMRCLALAEMLGPTYRRRLAIVQPAPAVVQLIEEKGVEIVWLERSEHFFGVLEPDEVVVLDGYAFDEDYQLVCRDLARTLVYIDDLCQPDPVADVVINHAAGVSRMDYYGDAPFAYRDVELLLGPDYALLRSPFLSGNFLANPSINGPIFINLGGADPQNSSITVVENLLEIVPMQVIRLVLGVFHPNRVQLETLARRHSTLTILQNLSASEMATEMRQCSLAITACSTVAYEVCAVNRPLIAIQTADNQQRLRLFFGKEQLALAAFSAEQLDDRLTLALQKAHDPIFVQETLKNQRRFFDGRSPERFRALFKRLTT